MNNWVYFPLQEKDYYTVTTTHYKPYTVTATCYDPPLYENKHIRYFNCKRCGAVGQQEVCEYCGSAEEGESNDNT